MILTKEKVRYHLLDTIRGIALINMIVYHFIYSMIYIFGFSMEWFGNTWTQIWQQCICWTFIIISGAAVNLGTNQLKRGAEVFGCGCVVTLVTIFVTPANRIIFGILSFIGIAMIITYYLMPLYKKLPKGIMLLLNFALFFLTKPITNYRYDIKGLFFLGFKSRDFFSADYFPLIPWIFLFWFGFFGFGIILEKYSNNPILKIKIPFLSYIGKHTLIIYMLHQPVIFLVGNLICK